MNLFLVNQDHPDAKGLMIKLSEGAKDGAIIPLSDGEMSLYNSNDFKWLNTNQSSNQIMTKIEKGQGYVFVVDPHKTIIDDILKLEDRLKIKVSVIRVRA